MATEHHGARNPTTHDRLREALNSRDALWKAILLGLEQRDPQAADAVRRAFAEKPRFLHAYAGSSTSQAAWAWGFLDAQAREEWIWACETVQQLWIRGVVGNRRAFR